MDNLFLVLLSSCSPFSPKIDCDRIGAFIRRTLIYKFKEQLQEGMVFMISSIDFACNSGSYRPSHNEYKLNFTTNTKIKISKSSLVPTNIWCLDWGGFCLYEDLKSIILKTLQAQDVPNKEKYKVQDA
ncbi:DUF223 domain protein [Medicago truncatula]|uniref:DUF223 domain protein n=1 Tax=Medicago truncatula TaxID=3880 RepID=A0A072U7X7_MEDTR|nr:DUF223 domain protein [Medicago truncatula]